MSKRRLSEPDEIIPTTDMDIVSIKQENVPGGSRHDYDKAKGRLNVVLNQLVENTDSDSSSDEGFRPSKKKKNSPTFRHTYVMKLFDRSVDLAMFEEDTPLYPICRAWMANQPRNSNLNNRSSLNDETNLWQSNSFTDIYKLPNPKASDAKRIPSPTPDQRVKVAEIDFKADPVPKDELIRNHLKRWVTVKRKWIKTVANYEQRFGASKLVLQAIYNKAQETMME